MSGTIINQLLMERYKQLVNERYVEPKEEDVIGTFLHIRDIADIAVEVVPMEPKKKKKKVDKQQKCCQGFRHYKFF